MVSREGLFQHSKCLVYKYMETVIRKALEEFMNKVGQMREAQELKTTTEGGEAAVWAGMLEKEVDEMKLSIEQDYFRFD